jgi:hypothetical protein
MAIEVMRPPAHIKDVQKLMGMLAALSRFISRLAEKALPFFKLLRRSGPFSWTEEAEQAIQELKQHLTSLPIPVAPEPGEALFLYLAATAEVVSMVLVAERTVQHPQSCPGSRRPAGSPPGEENNKLRAEDPAAQEADEAQHGGPGLATVVQTVQRPVYYVNEVLHEAKARYS